jgi:hypothetical protein
MLANRSGVLWAILIVGVLAGFLLGKWRGKSESRDTFVDNPQLIKQIAELATLEVQGNAKLLESNTTVSKTFWNDLSDFLGERTLSVEIPYTAKYGTDLSKSDIEIVKKNKTTVKLELEKPALQSLELRVDKLQQFTKNGVFVFQKDDKLKMPIQKLYSETRKKLTENAENIKLAEAEVEKVINKFYATMGFEVTYLWKK